MGERHDLLRDHLQPNGGGEAGRFGKTRLGIAQLQMIACLALDMNDERAGTLLLRNLKAGFAQAFSIAGTISCSMSWIGPSGITVEMACL
jgi:hypothetical protein